MKIHTCLMERSVTSLSSFSQWVRQTRRAKNLTLVEVADRAGTVQPVWSKWESGKYTPRRETVIRIADALGVDRDEALTRAGYLPMRPPEETTQREPLLLDIAPDGSLKDVQPVSQTEDEQEELKSLLERALRMLDKNAKN